MQNQGLGMDSDKMCAEIATKNSSNTPQFNWSCNRPKHLGYFGKKSLPGVRSPWLQQQFFRQKHKTRIKIIIPIIVGGTVIITIWNHKVFVSGWGDLTFCNFLHPIFFATTIDPSFLQKYGGIFASGLSLFAVGLWCLRITSSFSEKATKICTIFLMVWTFTKGQ